MSITTELAKRMKAAALKATPGEWVYLPSNTSIEYDYGSDDSQGSITYMDSGDFTQKQTELNGIFIALANPANVLALVEALEAALKRIAELETYSKTTLEFREAALNENRNLKLELEIAEKRIAELEARTVKLPQRLQPGADGYDDWYVHSADDGEYLKADDVIAALAAACVAVEGDTNANNN